MLFISFSAWLLLAVGSVDSIVVIIENVKKLTTLSAGTTAFSNKILFNAYFKEKVMQK